MGLFQVTAALRCLFPVLLIIAAVVTGCLPHARAQASVGRHGQPPQGIDTAALFRLTTHRGDKLDPAAFRRRPFALVFGFTHCPDVCPTTLLHLKTMLDDLGEPARNFPVLFVTVDPDRDVVDVLAPYVTSIDARIVGLTGTAIEIDETAHAFNAFYERQAPSSAGYTVDHTTRVYVIDKFGLLADAHDPAKEADRLRVTITKILRQ